MRSTLFFFFYFLALSIHSFSQNNWTSISTGTEASFRALSVVDDSVVWVSGTKGTVGKSLNGGKTWTFQSVKDFDKFDFRSLYAFDKDRAVIANAGAPANILYTSNGGKDWSIVFTHADTAAFFDGIDFWNDKEGIIYGDPIGGKMLLLKTSDGGKTWKQALSSERPTLFEGEASFAASGTNIRCSGTSSVVIATGGLVSRLFSSNDKGKTWTSIQPPIIQGKQTRGIFSFNFIDKSNGIIVGGDFLVDTLKVNQAFYTTDSGKTWLTPAKSTRGYRECVEYVTKDVVLAVGPSGSDISNDGGKTWLPLSDEKYYHVVRRARKGTLLVMAGGKGKVSISAATKK
jgi:photosystem II stability/assembly factor-like uncharacterized protein